MLLAAVLVHGRRAPKAADQGVGHARRAVRSPCCVVCELSL